MGRVNRHGWIVLHSIASLDGQWCVDLFQWPAGAFGFEHFRADPEDGGGWTPVGGFSSTRFATTADAALRCRQQIPWVTTEPSAGRSLDRWLEPGD